MGVSELSDDQVEEISNDLQQNSSALHQNAVNSLSNAVSSSSAAGSHIFNALSNPDGDSDGDSEVPEDELDAVSAVIHLQMAGIT